MTGLQHAQCTSDAVQTLFTPLAQNAQDSFHKSKLTVLANTTLVAPSRLLSPCDEGIWGLGHDVEGWKIVAMLTWWGTVQEVHGDVGVDMAIVGGCMTWGQEQHPHAGLQLCLLC